MRTWWLIVVALALIGSPRRSHAQDEHSHPAGDLGRVGKTHFPVSCTPELQPDFDRAVAVLHSFFYEESERQFAAIAARDPHCAMAWWGVAMSLWHPLWEPPDSSSLARGWVAIQRADSLRAGSDRERGYIAALASFYRDAAHVDHRTRALAYERAMEKLHADFPDDTEAAIFYALALNATLLYSDKTYAQQLRAGAILEPLYAKLPDHPGVAHYLIHSYDFPTLAARALPMARHYAEVAPHVPHALHMPSHIFTRLGYVGRVHPVEPGRRAGRPRVLRHALWRGGVLRRRARVGLPGVRLSTERSGPLGACDSRQRHADRARQPPDAVVLLRHHRGAGSLRARTSRVELTPRRSSFPTGWTWTKYPWTEATTQFAKGLGAARSGKPDIARAAIARLAAIRDGIVNPGAAVLGGAGRGAASHRGGVARVVRRITRAKRWSTCVPQQRSRTRRRSARSHPGPCCPRASYWATCWW